MIKLIGTTLYVGANIYTRSRAIRCKVDFCGRAAETIGGLGLGATIDDWLPGIAERLGAAGLDALTLGGALAQISLELQRDGDCAVPLVALSVERADGTEIIYGYETEAVGRDAGALARDWLRDLLGTDDRDPEFDFGEERRLFLRQVRRRAPGPSTAALIAAAERRGIPWLRLDGNSLIQFGYGKYQTRIEATATSLTPHIAVNLATNRRMANRLLGDLGVPVPGQRLVFDVEEAIAAAERLGYPVVVKPMQPSNGEGVSLNLADAQAVADAFALAAEAGRRVLVESQIPGSTYRLLVVDGALIGAVRQDPALAEDEDADVLDRIHPDNRALAVRAMRAIGLDVGAIDFVSPDIAVSYRDNDAGITGIEPAPSFRPFLNPDAPAEQDPAERVMRMLFPPQAPSRIPMAALTGTNGKTTTARMLAHILKFAGHNVGLTTTDAVYINGILTVKGDMTGPNAARMVLTDPLVDAAVLETARGGLVRNGLGYDRCDVGAVLNVTEDHIGIGGIETLADLAHVKRIVVEAASDTAVLNADDPLCLLMADHSPAKHIHYVTRNPHHALVRAHIRAGGRATVLEQGLNGDQIMLYDRGAQIPLIWTHLIPATLEGKALHNVENAMFAASMAHALGKSLDEIRSGLRTFDMSYFQAPGRLNVYDQHPFRAILDYGHNPAAMKAMVSTVERMAPKGKRIVVVMVPGDRRSEDIMAVAATLAGHFDHYICKQNDDRRGREDGELPELVRQALLDHGVSQDQILVIPDEAVAVDTALTMAGPGDLVLIFGEKTARCWKQIIYFGKTQPAEA